MIKPEQVPEDAWVEVVLRLESVGCLVPNSVAKLIVAEAINAWTGMTYMEPDLAKGIIILPLTENSDDKA